MCDEALHYLVLWSGFVRCHECGKDLATARKVDDVCCDDQDVNEIDGVYVCVSCGSVYGYKLVHNYVNFHENKFRIKRKSRYHRKYHVMNVINDACAKHKYQLTLIDQLRAMKRFNEVIVALKEKSGGKRLISIKFLLMKVFQELGLRHDIFDVSNSKGTLQKYEGLWNVIG